MVRGLALDRCAKDNGVIQVRDGRFRLHRIAHLHHDGIGLVDQYLCGAGVLRAPCVAPYWAGRTGRTLTL